MLEYFVKQKYPVVIAVLGSILVTVAFFDVEDIAKLKVSPASDPVYPIFILGVLLVVVSVLVFLRDEQSQSWIQPSSVKTFDSGYTTQVAKSNINVIYGRIEDCENKGSSAVFALPANEFFDDECINDNKSALGAFMQAKFPGQISEIQDLIKDSLKGFESNDVEKKSGLLQSSYGVGTSMLLEHLLASKYTIILAAVTTQRAGDGLRAEISFISQALNEIHRIMLDKRMDELFIPVIGSGHGGLSSEVALFSMVLALCEILKRPSGHHLRSVNIVVYRANDKTKPDINPKVVKQILRTATGMFKE